MQIRACGRQASIALPSLLMHTAAAKRTNATGSQAMVDCEVRYVGTGRIACATGRRSSAGRRAGGLFAAEEEDYVEEDEDGYYYFEGEHAALVELGDHEIVEFAGGFEFFADEGFVVVDADFCGA